jgi:alpha-L-rhamnosidase
MMTTVTDLRCEYRTNPLGIDVRTPRFSWRMETDRHGAKQTAYHILAASREDLLDEGQADLWDSGRVDRDQSVQIPYGGPASNSRQRVYWNVTVWDETGASSTSDSAWFELGLLNSDDWTAQWIGGSLVGGARTTIPAPYLRKSFVVSGSVQYARLYVTALGLYECSINGQIVGEDVFAPGWTDYKKRIQYQVYDVTDLLQSGDNVLGAILGDGWAAGHVGLGSRQTYIDRPRLLAQLEITGADGSVTTLVSDESWKFQYGPLLESDIMMGEAYDARLEWPGWDLSGFDDSTWHPVEVFEPTDAALVATNGPTVRRIEELQPVAEPENRGLFFDRRHIFDLGQNMVGRVRLKGSAPAGTTVILRFAEVLEPDGSLYTTNLRGARATDHYTFKGEGEEVWEPTFTFHGFRYVELSGYPGEVTRDTITGIVLHSDMAVTGHFECSDPVINQLQHNILWGQKGNFVDVPTDCPQRDERLGWTGDIQVFASTAAFNMDIAGFMTKWAQDVADAQSENGSIPAVVPSVIPLPDGGPAWADAVVICPWTMYLAYSDTDILEGNYPVMTRFMDFIIRESPGYIRCAPEYQGWHGFGDWLSINADTPRDLIGTAFLAYDAQLMSNIAEILGKNDDAARYRQLFADVRQVFADRYLVGSEVEVDLAALEAARLSVAGADQISRGNLKAVDYGPITSEVFNTSLFTPTQTAYVLALHFDLLPEELRKPAVDELVADIERRDGHLSTGFVGSPYLPHVLSSNGRADVAYRLLQQKTWPSWLYSVTQGATTIWERWDGWTEENGFQDPMMNSFNHYAYGAIGEWLYNTVAGIKIDPTQPAYKHIILRPQPGDDLTYAEGHLDSLYGEIRSKWELNDGVFTMSVTIPPNTTATIYLPEAQGQRVQLNGSEVHGVVHNLDAGKYEFTVGH